jgi:predicted esterase
MPIPIISFISYIISWFVWMHPVAWSTLPRCYNDAPISEDGNFPLIVWSHGLTGTGCEHGMLAAALALKGNIVALTHHSDGSSSLTDINTGLSISSATKLKYVHPNLKNYDKMFRQKQVEYRADEVEEARTLVLTKSDVSEYIAKDKIIVGGFSFGAATAGLVASKYPDTYKAAVLIDGWWHIELKQLKVNQDLPLQVHENGIRIPAIFIGSAEFETYEGLHDGTLRVQALTPKGEVHVLKDTRHGNFMDAMWWLPVWLSRSLKFSGSCDPHQTYTEYISLVLDFVDRITKSSPK